MMNTMLFQLLLFAQSNRLATVADWCGIVGLAVGLISVGFTLRAWWIIGRVDNVLKIERNKRILFSLLPEYNNKFRNIKKNIDEYRHIYKFRREIFMLRICFCAVLMFVSLTAIGLCNTENEITVTPTTHSI
ncbi:MAG: hypothetical protein LBE12_09670, partial [Planctomycetaceae bacterium]|nr:hypothetical protein [Planctomycetaceae bacterium]